MEKKVANTHSLHGFATQAMFIMQLPVKLTQNFTWVLFKNHQCSKQLAQCCNKFALEFSKF